MVADERDLPVGLVRGAVDPGARLAPEAADLVRRWGAEAAAEVLVEEQAHFVALDGQRIVVFALLELDVALAGLVVEGAVTWAAPLLASEVCDTRLPLRVAEADLVADGGGAARLFERSKALELVADVFARVASADLGDVDDAWPSLKSLYCLVFAALVLSPRTVCEVATAVIASYQPRMPPLWRRLWSASLVALSPK